MQACSVKLLKSKKKFFRTFIFNLILFHFFYYPNPIYMYLCFI